MKKLRIPKVTKEQFVDELSIIMEMAKQGNPTAALKRSRRLWKDQEELLRSTYEKGYQAGEKAERNFDKRLSAQH